MLIRRSFVCQIVFPSKNISIEETNSSILDKKRNQVNLSVLTAYPTSYRVVALLIGVLNLAMDIVSMWIY